MNEMSDVFFLRGGGTRVAGSRLVTLDHLSVLRRERVPDAVWLRRLKRAIEDPRREWCEDADGAPAVRAARFGSCFSSARMNEYRIYRKDHRVNTAGITDLRR